MSVTTRSFTYKRMLKAYEYRYEVRLTARALRSVFSNELTKEIVELVRPGRVHYQCRSDVSFDSNISITQLGDILHTLLIFEAEITQTKYPGYDLEENV